MLHIACLQNLVKLNSCAGRKGEASGGRLKINQREGSCRAQTEVIRE